MKSFFTLPYLAVFALCGFAGFAPAEAACVYNGLKCENPPYYRLYEQSCKGYSCPKYSTSENCDTVYGSIEEACAKDE